jgi:hypothetical protein
METSSHATRPPLHRSRCCTGSLDVSRQAHCGPLSRPFGSDLLLQVVRGKMPIRVECAPAFNYALSPHETRLVLDDSIPGNSPNSVQKQYKAVFTSDELTLDLRFVAESMTSGVDVPSVELSPLDLSHKGHKGHAVSADMMLVEGQAVTFVLRAPPNGVSPRLDVSAKLAQVLGVTVDSGSYRRTPIPSYLHIDLRIGVWRIQPSERRGSLPYQGRRPLSWH